MKTRNDIDACATLHIIPIYHRSIVLSDFVDNVLTLDTFSMWRSITLKADRKRQEIFLSRSTLITLMIIEQLRVTFSFYF